MSDAPAAGRPRGSQKIPADLFRERYQRVFEVLVERDGYSPTSKDLAAALGVTTPTLRKYMREAGITAGSSE